MENKHIDEVWFVYDGECPICNMAAQALRIRKAVGSLHVLDARQNADHPLMQKIAAQNINLDEGMVLAYNGVLYAGEDALHMMAMLGGNKGWFNRMNALLFKSKLLARVMYPSMKATRNMLLKCKRVEQLKNLERTSGQPEKKVKKL